ncbi:glucokinase [Thiomicrorhabdus cannonii]|uniref:glucokinase n=1 Tax=Thiomicrorhabdus cannonii TaxID=2748011 RepID=UPI0015C11BC0|nr:glucokinase [Thiomicrorhabdus cannonii]
MLLLAGDIGGTKALLQLIEYQPARGDVPAETRIIGQQRFLCQHFESLDAIVQTFLLSFNPLHQSIDSACFGLPGPVLGRRVQLTNLPWVVDADELGVACSLSEVHFINDFHAAALGVSSLSSNTVQTLLPAAPSGETAPHSPCDIHGHYLVVGAGTGLGVAPVFFDGVKALPVAHEGGHFDFAPISETQQCLLRWLWQRFEHVSYERVLSGPGLETLYEFFCRFDCPPSYRLTASQKLQKNRLKSSQNSEVGADIAQLMPECPANRPDRVFKHVSAAQIQQLADGGDAIAIKAMTEFVTIYGAFVGAAALFWNAPQGVYLAGGVAVKIQHWMRQPYFQQAYLEKGRMQGIVESRPVFLVTDENLGLGGAMQFNLQRMKA